MKYKAVMVMTGSNPTYWGHTVDEALERASNDCWVENHIGKGWVFADPEYDWNNYGFSNFIVYDMENKAIVMCVWNPALSNLCKEEY